MSMSQMRLFPVKMFNLVKLAVKLSCVIKYNFFHLASQSQGR